MARLATVWPLTKFRLDTGGSTLPSAEADTHPGAAGWVTVRFTTTADTPVDGTPPRPATCSTRSAPDPTGAPALLLPVRVSSTRAGDTVTSAPGARITQVKVVLPVAKVPSVAEMVTVLCPKTEEVPRISPVPELMARPGGRPMAA